MTGDSVEKGTHPFFTALNTLMDVIPHETSQLVGNWYAGMGNSLSDIAKGISKAQAAGAHDKVVLLDNLRTSLNTFDIPAKRFSRTRILTTHLRALLKSNNLQNKTVVCPVDVSAFITGNEDSVRLQYLKFSCRTEYGVKKAVLMITDIFRRRENRGKMPGRTFDGRGFLRIFLLIPFEKILLEEWNRFNRVSTDILGELNRYFDEQTPSASTVDERDLMATAFGKFEDEKKNALDRIVASLDMLFIQVHRRIRTAGTSLLPARRFNSAIARKEHRRFGRQFVNDREAWRRHWQGSLMDIYKDVDLIRLETEIRIIRCNVSDAIIRELENETEALFERVREAIVFMKERIATAETTTRKGVRTYLATERKTFSGSAADQLLTPISELVLSFDLEQMLSTFNTDLRATAELLQESYAIFTTSDKKRLTPQSQIEMVPLRELFLRHLDSVLNEYFEKTLEAGRNNLILLSNKPVIVGEVLESTFDTAYMELRKKEDGDNEKGCISQSLNEFSSGIDRTLSVLDEMHDQLALTIGELNRLLTETENSLQVYLNDLRRSDRLLTLRLQLVKSRAANRFTSVKKALAGIVLGGGKTILYRSKKLALWLWTPIASRLRAFFRFTRLDVDIAGHDRSNVESYLKIARSALDSLPAVYRRTFRFEPLDSEKLLIDRDQELSSIGEAFNNWHSGTTGLVALTGERGSGRSSVARIARNRYFKSITVSRAVPEKTVHDETELAAFIVKLLGMPQSESIDRLEQELIQSDDYRVMILEDIHQIFLRTITGLQIFKRFLLFASRTQGTVFWFLTCAAYTWRYLDKVLGLNRYFSTVVHLKGFGEEDVEELIMRRHRLCGIPLTFIADQTTARSKKYRQCANKRERQQLLQRQFFKKLTDASTGNASVAMLLWCITIRNHEHKMFEIGSLPDLGIRIDTTVTMEELFVIAAIVQHERMSPDDCANVLSFTQDAALLHLTGLRNKGILVEKNGFYELHFFLYRSFIGYLHEKRLFH